MWAATVDTVHCQSRAAATDRTFSLELARWDSSVSCPFSAHWPRNAVIDSTSPVPLRGEELGRQARQVLLAARQEGPTQAQACRGDAQRQPVAAALAHGGAVQHPLLLAARRPHLRSMD